jgi:LmbE family N-acetylglucosaminyl deacetylase
MTYKNVLAFGAHPDDLEVGAGGVLARFARAGASVTMVVSSVPNQPAVRKREAKRAAELLGVELALLPIQRLETLPMSELVARYDAIVAKARPELVITQSAGDVHHDHVMVHRASIAALRRTRCDVWSYIAGPLLGGTERRLGQCFADVSSTIDVKLAAIAAHASQRIDIESRKAIARAMGALSRCTYAEVFEVIRMQI